jgi:hypothetical protein
MFPEILTNFTSERDLYVLTKKPIPTNGWYYIPPLNTELDFNKVISNLTTKSEFYYSGTFSQWPCVTNPSIPPDWGDSITYSHSWHIGDGSSPELVRTMVRKDLMSRVQSPTTNTTVYTNVPVFATGATFDGSAFGLVYDSTNAVGIWQNAGSQTSASADIGFSQFVGASIPSGSNNFWTGWSSSAARVLIKWGFNFHD